MKISPEQEGLAKFTLNTRWEDLPATVIQDVKLFLLDSLGCALAGITTDPGKMVITLATRLGGPPESSIIGIGGKVSCTSAVMANSQLINTLDYEAISGHAPPYIVPPPLALGESTGASGKEIILALAIGLEISARIAGALSKWFFPGPDGKVQWVTRAGYAYCNFGAVAAAGKIMHLDHEKMVNALGIAGHLGQIPTWMRYTYQDHRAMTKYGVPGWQNTGAVIAALLAEMGYTGDRTVFDAKEGFWKFAGYDGWNPVKILEGIGKDWTYFSKIIYKPYPCCRMFQTELDLFLKIKEKNHLRAEEIESINIIGHPTLEMPAFTNRELKSIVDIQFGPSYIFAMAAYDVPRGVDWQDMELARSPRIFEFAKKVSYRGAPDFGSRPISRIEVVARGQTFSEEKPQSQLYEMTTDDLLTKFKHNASRVLTEEKIQAALNALLELEKLDNISKLMSLITL